MTEFNVQQFMNGPMHDIGYNKNYAFTREECVTNIDNWALHELQSIDENCLETYLKDYSRSYYMKDFHLKSLMQYNRPDPLSSVWDLKIANQVKESIRIELEGQNVLPVSLSVKTELDNVKYVSSSSAGFSYLGKKGIFRDSNHRRAMGRAKKMVLDYYDTQGECVKDAIMRSTPYIGYTRTQLTNITEKLKVRAVWGSPFQHIIAEGLSAGPFIEQIVNNNTFIHIGGDPLVTVPHLITQIGNKYKFVYTYDWSAFDATCSRFEINLAFDIVESLMTFKEPEDKAAFDVMRKLFIYKKVVGPDGVIYTVNTGVPSGSYWTTIINSIINKFRINYLWTIITGKSIDELHTHGDDGIGGSDTHVSAWELSVEAIKYGWILNFEKSEINVDISLAEFLGRTTTGGLSRRSVQRCLRLLVFPEYPVESPRISSYRAQSIFEDVGRTSEKIGKVAASLLRKYGIEEESNIPVLHRRFKY